MGTTNEIKSTNIGQALIGKTCQGCEKKFAEKDIYEDNNWEIQFDTSNDVNLVDNEKGGYNLTIWIRNVYHSDCYQAEEDNKVEEKTEWEKLGEEIKNSHPLDNYNKALKKAVEINSAEQINKKKENGE